MIYFINFRNCLCERNEHDIEYFECFRGYKNGLNNTRHYHKSKIKTIYFQF